MRKGTAVRAAVVMAVLLGAAGCGTGDGGSSAAPSATPRAEDTGPVTKASAQADIEAAAADAGAPANYPSVAQMAATHCAASYRGYGTESEKVGLERYEAVIGELRERGWQPSFEVPERKDENGTVQVVHKYFTKRGWTLSAEYQAFETGLINVKAADKACTDEISSRLPFSEDGTDGQ
ncbi:hypothetical protein ACFUT3_12740 [Streptomyces cinereoruber]|uniref:hypothetical protein n=1 Tax=Streptomyces cinereoruber TaxID=67260 RepID=UPI00362BF9D5